VHDNIVYRIRHNPALFRFKVIPTLDALKSALNKIPNVASKYPALNVFLQNEILIECISYLPYILNFQRFVHNLCYKRMTIDEAKSTTISKMLSQISSPTEQSHWREVFRKVKRGWTRAAPLVERSLVGSPDRLSVIKLSGEARALLCLSIDHLV